MVETPKFPILKFTAGLAVNPKPPKLNPLAVGLAVSSPPNPDRRADKEINTILTEGRGEKEERKKAREGLEDLIGGFIEANTPDLAANPS